jgi:aspartate/methionine/tyrosine aminotransferase
MFAWVQAEDPCRLAGALSRARVAAMKGHAFGMEDDEGWFRFSLGLPSHEVSRALHEVRREYRR